MERRYQPTQPEQQKLKPKPEIIIWEFLANKPALEGLINGHPATHNRAKTTMRKMTEEHSTAIAKTLLEIRVDEKTHSNVAEGAVILLKNIPSDKLHPEIKAEIKKYSADKDDQKNSRKRKPVSPEARKKANIAKSKAKGGNPELDEQIIELTKRGHTRTEIADILGIDNPRKVSVALQRIRRQGIDIKLQREGDKNKQKAIEQVREQRAQQKTFSQISEELRIPLDTVMWYWKQAA